MFDQLNDIAHKCYNPLMDEWVLVSTHRTKRPWQGKREEADVASRPSYDSNCYLCPGNERAGFKINPKYDSCFVFTNDFAVMNDAADVQDNEKGLLKVASEKGFCEAICFSSDHSLTIPEMSLEDIHSVVKIW